MIFLKIINPFKFYYLPIASHVLKKINLKILGEKMQAILQKIYIVSEKRAVLFLPKNLSLIPTAKELYQS